MEKIIKIHISQKQKATKKPAQDLPAEEFESWPSGTQTLQQQA